MATRPWQKARSPLQQNTQVLEQELQNLASVRQAGTYNETPAPEFDYLSQAEQIAKQINNVNRRANRIREGKVQIVPEEVVIPVPGGGGGSATGNPNRKEFRALLQAIAGKESGGNYGAVNKDSGALGKYQIMPSNITGAGGWDMDALGRDITAQEFLSSPKLQERIARHRLRQYYRQHGVEGAASAWYSGDPNKWKNSRNPQGNYPSIYSYVQDILSRMGTRR